jgi:hypothetical protein
VSELRSGGPGDFSAALAADFTPAGFLDFLNTLEYDQANMRANLDGPSGPLLGRWFLAETTPNTLTITVDEPATWTVLVAPLLALAFFRLRGIL